MCTRDHVPDSKVHGANIGPIWGRQDPGGPHVGPMNFVIWGTLSSVNQKHNTVKVSNVCFLNVNVYFGLSPSICSQIYIYIYIHLLRFIEIFIRNKDQLYLKRMQTCLCNTYYTKSSTNSSVFDSWAFWWTSKFLLRIKTIFASDFVSSVRLLFI